MRIGNNQNNVTFQYNVTVHFPKKPKGDMRELASNWAINEGMILSDNVGFTRVLRGGKKVAVIDSSTPEGENLAPVNDFLKRKRPNKKNRQAYLDYRRTQNRFKDKLSEIARSEETKQLEYHA